jgi:hypothetical protein
MKQTLVTITALTGILASGSVLAHGDHSHVTPSHGLEHAVYAGLAIAAGVIVFRLARKVWRAIKTS